MYVILSNYIKLHRLWSIAWKTCSLLAKRPMVGVDHGIRRGIGVAEHKELGVGSTALLVTKLRPCESSII